MEKERFYEIMEKSRRDKITLFFLITDWSEKFTLSNAELSEDGNSIEGTEKQGKFVGIDYHDIRTLVPKSGASIQW